MDEKELNTAGLLYLISRASERGFPFRIRLQKMALLGKLEFSFPFSFGYESHFYGPYSATLQTTLNELIVNDLVKEDARLLSEGQFGYFYTITKTGSDFLAKLSMPETETAKLDKLWVKYRRIDTGTLVRQAKNVSGIKSINE